MGSTTDLEKNYNVRGKTFLKKRKWRKMHLECSYSLWDFHTWFLWGLSRLHSVWNDQYHAISSFSLPLTDCTLLKRRLFCYQCLTLVLFQTCMTFFHGTYEGCSFPYDFRKYWSFQTWKRTRIIKVVHTIHTLYSKSSRFLQASSTLVTRWSLKL